MNDDLRKWTKIVIFTSITSQIRLTNMRSTVKKAAIFDVYADTIMSEKNHQAHPTSLPAIDFGAKLVYWCINVPIVNHRLKLQKRNAKRFASNWKKKVWSKKYLLLILNGFLTLVPTKLSSILHSHGENRETRNKTMLTPK